MPATTITLRASADNAALPTGMMRRARWWGLVGTTLLAIGAWGTGVLPRPDPQADAPVFRLLRDGAGVPISIAFAALGMALWVAAWWSLRTRLSYGLSARWIGVTAAWWSLPLALAPPLLSRDVYSYAAQGQVAAHGLNPYEHGPAELTSDWTTSTSPSWYYSHAPYGPLFVIVARGAALLGEATGQIEVAVLALRLVAIGAVALLAVYLPRLARRCGVDPGRAQWLAVGCPLLLVHSVSGAHNDIVMLAFVVTGLAYAAERRWLPAGLLLGAAIAVKAPALVVLPFAVLLTLTLAPRSGTRHAPPTRAAALVGAAAGSLLALTVTAGFGWGWIDALSVPGGSVQWTSLPTSWGIAATWLAGPFLVPDAEHPAVRVARGIGTGLLGLVLIGIWSRTAWRLLRPRHTANDGMAQGAVSSPTEATRRVVLACGLALLALTILAPAFHPWYFLWPLVLLAASVNKVAGHTAMAGPAAALCFLVLPDGYNLARATAPVGVTVVVVVTVVTAGAAVAMAIRRQRQLRRFRATG